MKHIPRRFVTLILVMAGIYIIVITCQTFAAEAYMKTLGGIILTSVWWYLTYVFSFERAP